MAGSTFGTLFRVTTWGETHGKGVGVVAKEIEGRVAFESEKSVLFTHGEGLKKRK